jgi:hypothetical protein
MNSRWHRCIFGRKVHVPLQGSRNVRYTPGFIFPPSVDRKGGAGKQITAETFYLIHHRALLPCAPGPIPILNSTPPWADQTQPAHPDPDQSRAFFASHGNTLPKQALSVTPTRDRSEDVNVEEGWYVQEAFCVWMKEEIGMRRGLSLQIHISARGACGVSHWCACLRNDR